MEAEHTPHADGHIRVAGEVKVNLHGIAHRPQPGHPGGEFPGLQAVGEVGHHRKLIGQKDFFAQAHQKAAHPHGEVGPVLPPAVDLLGHRLVFDDGPGDELGEKGDVQGHLQWVALYLAPVPVHVQYIGEGLKGEKRDPQGQLDARDEKLGPQAVELREDEDQVLKDKHQPQIAHQRAHDGQAAAASPDFAAMYPQPEAVIGQDGGHHHQHKPGLSPGVEKQGAHQQQQILGRAAPPPQQAAGAVVGQHHQG